MMRALAVLFAASLAPVGAFAQSVGTISMSPTFASAGSLVRFELSSPLIDLSNSTIEWFIDGASVGSGLGLTTVQGRLGAAGEPTDVTAVVAHSDGTSEVTTRITPGGISLAWEAEGYTPPFYRGRRVPSSGTKVRLVAIAAFSGDGGNARAEDLIYTWRRGSTVLGSLSGRGKNTLTIDSPLVFGTETISVEVRSADGDVGARASARLTSERPPLFLYENHPLFGILFHRALSASASIADTERTFSAFPFFAPASSAENPALEYAWRVNRRAVAPDPAKPSEITINASGSDGVAIIELFVTHASNLFYSADGRWRATFDSITGAGGPGDPFAPQGPQN